MYAARSAPMLKVPLQVVVNENRRYPVIVRSEKNKNSKKKGELQIREV